MDHMDRLDERLIATAAVAADLWRLRNADKTLTEQERTLGLARAVVVHLVDNELLLVPDDLTERLNQPAKTWRDTQPCGGDGTVEA